MFEATWNEDGTATVSLSLTVTTPDLEDAHFVMKRIREITSAPGRSVAQGDFITRVTVLKEASDGQQ